MFDPQLFCFSSTSWGFWISRAGFCVSLVVFLDFVFLGAFAVFKGAVVILGIIGGAFMIFRFLCVAQKFKDVLRFLFFL